MELVGSGQGRELDKEAESLASLARVCQRWRDPTQRALFTSLHLNCQYDSARCSLLLASPALGRYRQSSLQITTGKRQEAAITQVLQRCEGIRNLTLEERHGFGRILLAQKLDWGVLAFPALAGLSSLGLCYPEALLDPPLPHPLLPFRLSRLLLELVASSVESLVELHLRFSGPVGRRMAATLSTTAVLAAKHLRSLVLEFQGYVPQQLRPLPRCIVL